MEDSNRISQIKLIMKKTGINFEKAEKLFQKSNDDPNIAIQAYFKRSNSAFLKVLKWFYGIVQYKLIVRGKKMTFLRIPLWFLAILAYLLLKDSSYYYILRYLLIAVLTALIVIIILHLEVLITNREKEGTVSLVRKPREDTMTQDKEYEVEETDGVLRIIVRD
ncbi:MAG: hypothetical protein JXN10_09075 [Clostridia bacterium]|nr:hypothetical protein [Clostridia bacterium]MBN2883671.1 hypothetical protein [Clostridia bacterium]